MTITYGSAGVTATEIDISGPVVQKPTGIPAGVIGTSPKGPAFAPITVGVFSDYSAKFGASDGKKFMPLAANEWLRNQSSLTAVRVLGVGDGKTRNPDGSVTNAGFTVGENEPNTSLPISDPAYGNLVYNPYAIAGGPHGRTYFLGALMSASAGSSLFSSASINAPSVPVVRGVVMAANGVILRLANDEYNNANPPSSVVAAADATARGMSIGTVTTSSNGTVKQDFRLLLNGIPGTDPSYPNVITASFDPNASNYFANVFNTDPYKLQQTGHFLYANYDILTSQAGVNGTGIMTGSTLAFLVTGSSIATAPNYEAFTDRFSNARSPWIVSQHFGGVTQNLFRIWALDSGANISTLYKISVENIAASSDNTTPFGTFDVTIRDWNDTDGNVSYLEQWRGLSLDPSSPRYISNVIGDLHTYFDFDRSDSEQKLAIDGDFENASNLVRVEVADDVQNGTIEPTALPFGFASPLHLVTTSGSLDGTLCNFVTGAIQPPLPLRQNITNGSGAKALVNPQLYWGVQFEHQASLDMPNGTTLKNASLNSWAKYFPEFSTTPVVIGDDTFCNNEFSLENVKIVTGSAGNADPSQWASATYVRNANGVIAANDTTKTRGLAVSDLTSANKRFIKFTTLMQGGFDGTNIFDKDEAEINNAAVVADMDNVSRGRNNGPNVMAYRKAIQLMQSTTEVDVQLLLVPGIRHPAVTDTLIAAVEERFDALAIIDIEQIDGNGDNVVGDDQQPVVNASVDQFAGRLADSSFAAAYFPDVVMTDPTTKTNVVVPPSVAVLGALALNDKLAQPWFAPAGMTRGSLQTTLETRVKLSKNDMDALYNVNVNPLVAFPGNGTGGTAPTGGVVVWGQKTLQASASALDRVNVRRLLINLRRQVRDVAQTIMFEPNREATLARFQNAVTPILQRVQKLSGIEKYKVQIDTTTTTQADILNNSIRGKIYIVPLRAIEFVSLDFVVSNPGSGV